MVRKTSLFLCLVALLCYLLSLLAKRNSQSSTMLELIKDQSVWIFSILARVKSKKRNKGSFNNYVDKMRGGGGQKISVFVPTQVIKLFTTQKNRTSFMYDPKDK